MAFRSALAIVGFALGVASAWAPAARAQTPPSFGCGAALLSPTTEHEEGEPAYLLVADIDGDGVLDRITGNTIGIYIVYRGPNALAAASYQSQDKPTTPLLARDLDGDGSAEIVASQADTVLILKADGSGALHVTATLALPALSANRPTAFAGHFRSRSAIDLVVGDDLGGLSLYTISSSSLTRVSGVTTLMAATLSAPFDRSVVVGDMDGDGLDDLVFPVDHGVAMARLGTRATWDMFQTLALPQGRSRYISASLGDFDGDGRRDLLIQPADAGTEPSPLNTWLQKTVSAFTPIADVAAGSWTWGTPVLVGDLDRDGSDDFVTKTFTGRLVQDAWVIAPFSVQVPLVLVDWDGDGLLDYDAQSNALDTLHAHGASADLGLMLGDVPASIDAYSPFTATFVVTNAGPTATRGLALGTSPNLGQLSIPGCDDPTKGCPDLVLAPGQSLTVTVSGFSPLVSGTVDVAVCGGAPDPVPGNDVLHLPLVITDVVDVGAELSGQFNEASFVASAQAINGGPSVARDVTLVIQLPPSAVVAHVTPNPSASCQTKGTTVTCMLDSLDAQKTLTVMLDGGFGYRGQAVTVSATATTSTKDRDPSDDTFTISLPALAGVGPPVGLPGTTTGSGGCACTLASAREDSASSAAIVTALAAFASAATRRRRRRP